MTSLVDLCEEDLVCQKEELFKKLFDISNYANGIGVIMKKKLNLSEALQNILRMKLIAEELLNLLNEHFYLKKSKEDSNLDKILHLNNVFKKEAGNKTDQELLEHTEMNGQDCIVNIDLKDPEVNLLKPDVSLQFNIIKEEVEFDTEEDTNIQIENDHQSDSENSINIMKFICDHCTFGTNRFVTMRRHMRDNHKLMYEMFLNAHNILYIFQCDFCEERFKTNVAGTKHVEHSHPEHWDEYVTKYKTFQCEQCTSSFFTRARLRSHGLKVHKIIKGEMLPNGKFKKPRSVNISDQLPHLAKRKCKYCPKILSNLTQYTDHLLVHEIGEKPFACDQCTFRSNRRKSLKAHVKEHLVSTYLCKNCGIVTDSKYDLKTHMKKFHKVINKPNKAVTKKEGGSVTCDECGKCFSHKRNLTSHMLVHQEEGNKPICDLCGQKSVSHHNLKNHRLLHFPPTLKCDECEELFHTSIYLKRHQKDVHTHIKEYNCEQCGKGFNSKCTYEGHMNMHLGIKPFKCRYCEMAYQNASNCMAHEKKTHKDIYVKRCNNLKGVRVRTKESKSINDVGPVSHF